MIEPGEIVPYLEESDLYALQEEWRGAEEVRWDREWAAAWAGIGWLASVEAAINVTGGLLNALAARHEQLVVAVTNMGIDVKTLMRDAKRKGKR